MAGFSLGVQVGFTIIRRKLLFERNDRLLEKKQAVLEKGVVI